MQYHHVVQMFTNGKLYFSHPSKWDDPYETRVKHAWEKMLYAQCWCKRSMSDAMWRIYSQNLTSLRIRTSKFKLENAMRDFCAANKGYLRRVQEVSYLSTSLLNDKTHQLATSLRNAEGKQAISAAADILCFKRNAFDHEAEVRAILYCPSKDNVIPKPGISIDIKVHEFVDSILIDPRAPDELVDTFVHYFKDVLGFKGVVARSALYKGPEIIAVD